MGGIMFSLKYRQSRSHLSTLLSAIHISALKDNCLFRWRLSPSIANIGVCPWWEALILLPTHITRHSNPSGWLESVWNREALSQMIEEKRKTNGNIKPRLHKHRPNQWSPSTTLLTSLKKQTLCAHIRGDIWKQPQCLVNCSDSYLLPSKQFPLERHSAVGLCQPFGLPSPGLPGKGSLSICYLLKRSHK